MPSLRAVTSRFFGPRLVRSIPVKATGTKFPRGATFPNACFTKWGRWESNPPTADILENLSTLLA